MACLWGYYLRVSSGRSWVHHTTLGPYLCRRHSLISIPLPVPTYVPIAPRQRDWKHSAPVNIHRRQGGTSGSDSAPVQRDWCTILQTDARCIYEAQGSPTMQKFTLRTFSNDGDDDEVDVCLHYDTAYVFPEVCWNTTVSLGKQLYNHVHVIIVIVVICGLTIRFF